MDNLIRHKNILLVDISRLKEESFLENTVDDREIRIAVKYVQDIIVKRVIGKCLLHRLQEVICNNDPFMDIPYHHKYRELLDDYLFPIFQWGVLARLQIPLTYSTRGSGVVKTQSSNVETVPMTDLNMIIRNYENDRDTYITEAINFLCCNRDCFPELCCCECGWYQSALNKDYGLQINLKNNDRRLIKWAGNWTE